MAQEYYPSGRFGSLSNESDELRNRDVQRFCRGPEARSSHPVLLG
jgi:hypothetical protein